MGCALVPSFVRAVVPVVLAGMVALAGLPVHGQLSGAIGIHDPSSIIKDGSTYHIYGTGNGVAAKWSSDGITWRDETSGVFATPPAWTTQAVPTFTGFFWAPDIAYFNGAYHLYYSVSSWGSIDSAIGVATTASLNNPTWVDQGKVVQSDAAGNTSATTDTTGYNAIDPSILVDDATGKVWMTWGSYSSGIMVTEIDPASGKRIGGGPLGTQVANKAANRGWGSSIEGAAMVKKGDFYYLFVNYGGCCSGVNSTYDIRVGRSQSPTGPFRDKNGVDLRDGGGTVFLDDNGRMVGPGHFAFSVDSGQDLFSYHYYNADANGAPTLGIHSLSWTSDNWPISAAVNPDWTGSGGSTWSTASNWSAGGVPDGVGHVANFVTNSARRYLVSVDGGDKTVGTINFRGSNGFTVGGVSGSVITLDAATGEAASINVSDGSHTISAPVAAVENLAVNTTTASRLTLSGSVTAPGLTKYGHGTMALAGSGSFSKPLLIRWGAVDVTGTVTATGYASLGPLAFETGTMTVRGAGSVIAKNDFNVGDTGNAWDAAQGVLEVRDTAALTVGTSGGLFVGSGYSANTRASGTVNQSGGTVTVTNPGDGFFVIGGRGSAVASGVYNLSGGAVYANTNMRVGGYGSGAVNQTGGTFTANAWIAIGRFQGSAGSWSITSGTLNHTSPTTAIIVGEGGGGSFTVDGTGLVSTAGGVRIGLNRSAIGTLHLDGGTLLTPGITRGSGTGSVQFNGGTLQASRSTTSFVTGLTSATVEAGGAVVDTQLFTVTVGQALLHDAALGAAADGGLTKRGAGTLVLSAANTFTGETRVESGTLRIGHDLALATSPAVVSAGATLAIDNGVSAVLPSLVLSGGRLDLGTGQVTVSGGLSHAVLAASLRAGLGDGRWNGSTGIASAAVFAALAANSPGRLDGSRRVPRSPLRFPPLATPTSTAPSISSMRRAFLPAASSTRAPPPPGAKEILAMTASSTCSTRLIFCRRPSSTPAGISQPALHPWCRCPSRALRSCLRAASRSLASCSASSLRPLVRLAHPRMAVQQGQSSGNTSLRALGATENRSVVVSIGSPSRLTGIGDGATTSTHGSCLRTTNSPVMSLASSSATTCAAAVAGNVRTSTTSSRPSSMSAVGASGWPPPACRPLQIAPTTIVPSTPPSGVRKEQP